MYDLATVYALADNRQAELLSLYYSYFHPSLPILEDRESFEAAISSRTIPASLLAAVFCAAICFWHLSPALRDVEPLSRSPLYNYVVSATAIETRTPSLRTIQALLIHMHMLPWAVREPNHPGSWALTSQVSSLYTFNLQIF